MATRIQVPITEAEAPFDHPNADVVLRTSDGVDFRVFKLLLSLVSPYFRKTFEKIQDVSNTTTDSFSEEELPVVNVNQESGTLAALLSFCYPKWCPEAVLQSTGDVEAVLTAAKEYEMGTVTQQIGSVLLHPRFEAMDPIRLFAIACRFRLADVARHAGKNTLFVPIWKRTYTAELEYITAGTLQRLQDYYYACSKAASTIGDDPSADFPWKVPNVQCSFKEGSCCGVVQCPAGQGRCYVRTWWNDFIRSASLALKQKPRGETVMCFDLMVQVLSKVSSCTVCREIPLMKFLEFRKQYAEEVERVVSEIKLELSSM